MAYNYLTRTPPSTLKNVAMGLLAATIVVSLLMPSDGSIVFYIMMWVYAAVAFGIVSSLYLSRSVLSCDDGTEEMRAVSDPIREGAEGFLRVQYSAIAKFAGPLALLILISYQFRPTGIETGAASLGNGVLGFVAALAFVFGAVCSAFSGYLSMWVAARSNIRVASAARRSYGEALVVCFRGGAFSAVLNLTLCIFGVTTFYLILNFTVASTTKLTSMDVPMLLVGYGFGASFV